MNEKSADTKEPSSIPDSQSDELILRILKLTSQTQIIHQLYLKLYSESSNNEDGKVLENYLKCQSCDWQLSESCSNINCISERKLTEEMTNINTGINICVVNEDRFFKCTLCSKKYRSKENLNLHRLNIHLNHKPYKCSLCPRRFSHRNGKLYHEKNFHS